MTRDDLLKQVTRAGLNWPTPPKPVAAYVPALRSGSLIFVSGQLPMKNGQLLAIGAVPSLVSVAQAQLAAQQCALNALAIVDDLLAGDWAKFRRIVRVGVFVCSDATFTEQPKVANGASEFLVAMLGDAGKHARAAVGSIALPLGASVEVEMVVEVE